MKSSKLFLTSLLAAATLSVPAYAVTTTTTTLDDVTYSGTIWTTTVSGASANLSDHARSYSDGTNSCAGDAQITGVGNFYNYFFNASETQYVGNTLRLTGATQNHTVTTDWENYAWFGGLITDANSHIYTIGRDPASTVSNFKLKGAAGVNMLINANTVIWGKGIEVLSSGTAENPLTNNAWNVAADKTLTLKADTTTFNANTATTIGGSGTVKFMGATTTLSNVAVNGSLSVASFATLDLSASKITLGSAIANSGTVTVNSNTIFVLSDSLKVADTGNTYSLISGGAINGWNAETLSATNFILSGASSSQRGATVVLTETGSVTYTAGSGEAANLTWKAGVSGTWDVQTTRSWTNDSTSADDVFYDYDNVTFATSGNVTVAIAAGGVTADTVTISAGTVSFTTNKVTAQSGFVVENGATLKLAANNNLGGTVTVKTGGVLDVSGKQTDLSANGLTEVILAGGKLANNSSTSVDTNSQQLWKITLTEDSSVGGVQSNGSSGGNFGLVGSGHGATTLDLGGYKLTKQDGGIFYLVNTTIKAGTFEIAGGTVQLAQRPSDGSAADFVLSGGSLDLYGKALSAKSVSGTSGTITLGAGTLTVGTGVTEESVKTFSGRVDGGSGTLTKAGSGTIVFSGNTTIGTLNVTGGFLVFTTDASVNKITGGAAGTIKIESGTVTMASSGAQADQNMLASSLEIGGVSDGNGGYKAAKLTGGFTDQLKRDASNRTIAVKGGGELQIGTADSGARWEIGSGTSGSGTSILLSNGGVISGLGDKYGALDFSATKTVKATGTGNTISAAVRLRSGDVTFNVAENSDLTISGTLQKMTSGRDTTNTTDNASGTLSKSGSGKLVLSGDNSKYGRAINVTAGTLVTAHAKALGTGTVTVSNGATLGVKVASAVTAGTVTFNEGAKFLIDLTGVSVEDNMALTIISSSAISFNSIETGSLTSEIIESYFDAGNSVLGDYSTWLREWSYDTTNGLQLTMTIPEPSVFGLLAGLGALALAGTRRRRKKA